MKKTRKSAGKSGGVTPATALLNRLIGPSPAPRMLTPYEITLLRRSKEEVDQVTGEVLASKDNTSRKQSRTRPV